MRMSAPAVISRFHPLKTVVRRRFRARPNGSIGPLRSPDKGANRTPLEGCLAARLPSGERQVVGRQAASRRGQIQLDSKWGVGLRYWPAAKRRTERVYARDRHVFSRAFARA